MGQTRACLRSWPFHRSTDIREHCWAFHPLGALPDDRYHYNTTSFLLRVHGDTPCNNDHFQDCCLDDRFLLWGDRLYCSIWFLPRRAHDGLNRFPDRSPADLLDRWFGISSDVRRAWQDNALYDFAFLDAFGLRNEDMTSLPLWWAPGHARKRSWRLAKILFSWYPQVRW